MTVNVRAMAVKAGGVEDTWRVELGMGGGEKFGDTAKEEAAGAGRPQKEKEGKVKKPGGRLCATPDTNLMSMVTGPPWKEDKEGEREGVLASAWRRPADGWVAEALEMASATLLLIRSIR